MDKTKEIIHDEQISPLITQIFDICKKSNISCVLSFALDQEDEDGNQLMCTTTLLNKESNPPDLFMQISDILLSRRRHSTYLTLDHVSDEVQEMIAII